MLNWPKLLSKAVSDPRLVSSWVHWLKPGDSHRFPSPGTINPLAPQLRMLTYIQEMHINVQYVHQSEMTDQSQLLIKLSLENTHTC